MASLVEEQIAKLREREKHYRSLFERNLAAIYLISLEGQILGCNEAFATLMGYSSPDEIQTTTAMQFYFKERHREAFLKNLLKKERLFNHETLLRRKDGSPVWVLEKVHLLRDNQGEVYIQGTAVDITERKEIEEALRYSEERYRSFFENSPLSLWEEDLSLVIDYMEKVHASGVEDVETYFKEHPKEVNRCAELIHVLDINPATLEMFDAKTKDEMITKMPTLFSDEVREMFIKEFVSFDRGDFRLEVEGNVKTLTGGEKYIHMIISLLSQHRILVSMTDLSERKKLEERLHLQAITDPLTQLFNRRYFFDLAQQELKRAQRYKCPISIILFDIDHFKKVNDSYGHSTGDEILRQISRRFKNILRETDIFARYGGEEFVVLLLESDQEKAFLTAERMRRSCIETSFHMDQFAIDITISFGVSGLSNEDMQLDELLLRADKALYQAKESGGNRGFIWMKE